MVSTQSQKILYIDSINLHNDDINAICLPPEKMHLISLFQKEVFDKAIIQNVPASSIKAIGFFYIGQVLKKSGILDVYVHQPISVMQSLDASEIEANAKLGGFPEVQSQDFEKWVKEGDVDVKISTIKLSMVRPDQVEMKKKK